MYNSNVLVNFLKVVSDNSIIGNYLSTQENVDKYENYYGDSIPQYIKTYVIILLIINIFIYAWALYTATKCAEPICNFLVALCAPHVYVIYRMARPPCLGK